MSVNQAADQLLQIVKNKLDEGCEKLGQYGGLFFPHPIRRNVFSCESLTTDVWLYIMSTLLSL